MGQGLANIVCGLFSGYTCSGSFTRSLVNYEAGAQTTFSSVFAGICTENDLAVTDHEGVAVREVVPDPAVTAIMESYNALIEDVQNLVIGETTTDITRNYRYESAMGDWVTDIMRAYEYAPGIDFAFTNSGGLR